MGSWAGSTTKDQRLAVEGDIGQIATPESAFANPQSQAIDAGDYSTIHSKWDNVSFGLDAGQVQSMLQEVLHDNDTVTEALSQVATSAVSSAAQQAESLSESIAALKSGESQILKYLPYGLAALVIIVSLRR